MHTHVHAHTRTCTHTYTIPLQTLTCINMYVLTEYDTESLQGRHYIVCDRVEKHTQTENIKSGLGKIKEKKRNGKKLEVIKKEEGMKNIRNKGKWINKT
jgi:hypothetical protein